MKQTGLKLKKFYLLTALLMAGLTGPAAIAQDGGGEPLPEDPNDEGPISDYIYPALIAGACLGYVLLKKQQSDKVLQ